MYSLDEKVLYKCKNAQPTLSYIKGSIDTCNFNAKPKTKIHTNYIKMPPSPSLVF